MKKKCVAMLILLGCCVCLGACASNESKNEPNTSMSAESDDTSETLEIAQGVYADANAVNENVYDLSNSLKYETKLSGDGSETVYCAPSFVTNSTQIQVQIKDFEGQGTVCLFYANDPKQNVILEQKFDAEHTEAVFTGLTSAAQYSVGILPDGELSFEVAVSE